MTFVIDTKMTDPETNTMIDTMTDIMIDTMKGMITKETEIMEGIDTAEDNKMMTKDTIDKEEVQGIRTDPNRRSNLMRSSID